MMNFQIKLRQQIGFCDPVGPAFSRARKYRFSIEGTEIEFRAPRHRPMIKSQKAFIPDKAYWYDSPKMHFRSLDPNHKALDKWQSVGLFWHDWAFNGPWFTGCLAHVSLGIAIYQAKSSAKAVSYFHPRAFEQTIGDFLTDIYSWEKEGGRHEYQAPINWQPVDSLGVPAARLEVISDGSVGLYSKDIKLYFPIDNDHFVAMGFRPSRSAPGTTEAEIDKLIGYKNLGELIDNIIGSVKVTLSAEAKAQQEEAIKGLEDTRLTRTFLPMKWK